MTTPELSPGGSPQPRKIQVSELQDISTQLWDTIIYGDFAADWLKYTCHDDAQAQLYRRREGYELRTRFTKASRIQEPEEALQTMRSLRPDLPYILGVKKADAPDRSTTRPLAYTLRPIGLSPTRIGGFLEHRRLVDHNFHGALGKALDVLAVASELKQPQDIGASHIDVPFVGFEELEEMASKLPYGESYRFVARLGHMVREQIKRSDIGKHGEVVLEGAVALEGTKLTFEQIARRSLAVVPDECSPTSKTALYLQRQFAPESEA